MQLFCPLSTFGMIYTGCSITSIFLTVFSCCFSLLSVRLFNDVALQIRRRLCFRTRIFFWPSYLSIGSVILKERNRRSTSKNYRSLKSYGNYQIVRKNNPSKWMIHEIHPIYSPFAPVFFLFSKSLLFKTKPNLDLKANQTIVNVLSTCFKGFKFNACIYM